MSDPIITDPAELAALNQVRSIVPLTDADAVGFLKLSFERRMLVLQTYADAAADAVKSLWDKICGVLAGAASFASMIAPLVGLGVSLAAL